jgi:hypothetical protein
LRLLISRVMVAAGTILCHGADPIPADHAIYPRSPVGGHGIGGEYFGRRTMARSRLRACDI